MLDKQGHSAENSQWPTVIFTPAYVLMTQYMHTSYAIIMYVSYSGKFLNGFIFKNFENA